MSANKVLNCGLRCDCVHASACALPTRVFPSLIPLDKADNEEDQDEESDGTHEADEPSLSGNVYLSARHSWSKEETKL